MTQLLDHPLARGSSSAVVEGSSVGVQTSLLIVSATADKALSELGKLSRTSKRLMSRQVLKALINSAGNVCCLKALKLPQTAQACNTD